MCKGCVKYTVYISNNHENIMTTGCGVHRDGYKYLMGDNGTHGASGVLFDGRKWYLWCVGCVLLLFVRGFLVVEVV